MDNKTYEESNSFLMTILCHGNKQGHLLDKNKSKACDTEDLIGDLSEVETLTAKPKIIIIQACHGSMTRLLLYLPYSLPVSVWLSNSAIAVKFQFKLMK